MKIIYEVTRTKERNVERIETGNRLIVRGTKEQIEVEIATRKEGQNQGRKQ